PSGAPPCPTCSKPTTRCRSMDMRAAIVSRAALFALAAVTVLAGCETVQTTQPGVVGVDRKQHFLVSSDEMNAAAADAQKWAWEFHVLSTPEVNAWCMPGGKIAVYSGLIDKIKPSDDELAAVLGHEIAHALREHSREQASQQMAEQIGLGVLGAGLGLSDVTQQLSGMLLKVGFELPHSRTDETEADRVG